MESYSAEERPSARTCHPTWGQRVEATVYELQEELPEFLRPYTRARAVVVTHKGKIIGAWIDKGRHHAFACSLDCKPLEELTGMDWSEWLVASGIVNLENEMERELATLTPEEIITRYYEALDDHDEERAYACLTRRSLTDFLFSNMGDLATYHADHNADPCRQRVHSVRVNGIELLAVVGNHEGVVEYKVDINVKYEPGQVFMQSSGRHVRFVLLKEEIAGPGWRITSIGAGPSNRLKPPLIPQPRCPNSCLTPTLIAPRRVTFSPHLRYTICV